MASNKHAKPKEDNKRNYTPKAGRASNGHGRNKGKNKPHNPFALTTDTTQTPLSEAMRRKADYNAHVAAEGRRVTTGTAGVAQVARATSISA